MIALGGNVAAARVPADAAHRASTVLYMTSHFSLSAKKVCYKLTSFYVAIIINLLSNALSRGLRDYLGKC